MTSSEASAINNEKDLLSNQPASSDHRIFAPLNIPWHRRCETLTILVWWLMPWACLYLTIVLLRSNSWYLTGSILLYILWMIVFRKYPKEGGHRQQWLRRLFWWKWFASSYRIFILVLFSLYF
jgi:hypothetical protein